MFWNSADETRRRPRARLVEQLHAAGKTTNEQRLLGQLLAVAASAAAYKASWLIPSALVLPPDDVDLETWVAWLKGVDSVAWVVLGIVGAICSAALLRAGPMSVRLLARGALASLVVASALKLQLVAWLLGRDSETSRLAAWLALASSLSGFLALLLFCAALGRWPSRAAGGCAPSSPARSSRGALGSSAYLFKSGAWLFGHDAFLPFDWRWEPLFALGHLHAKAERRPLRECEPELHIDRELNAERSNLGMCLQRRHGPF